MQIKMEQFSSWRGTKAIKEEAVFKTALLISEYSAHNSEISAIKRDYSDPKSKPYTILSQYSQRTNGLIVYAKLVVDEALKQLPFSAVEQRELLARLNEIITAVYINISDSPTQKIQSFFAQMKQLIAYDAPILVTREQTRALFTSFYILLHLANTYLNGFSFVKRSLAKTFGINLDELKAELAALLNATELRLQQLTQIPTLETEQQQDADEVIQSLFNKQYATILDEHKTPAVKINLMAQSLSETINGLQQLLDVKRCIVPLMAELATLRHLLSLFIKNDEQVTGRKYCLELIASQPKAFDLLISHLGENQKNEINSLSTQLCAPIPTQQFKSSVLYGISWLTILPVTAYRLITPLQVQKNIGNMLPATADSLAKQQIQHALQEVIRCLNSRLADFDQQKSNLIDALARNNIVLKERLDREPYAVLKQVLDTNQAVEGAIHAYAECATELQEHMNRLRQIQGADNTLSDFIAINDTFYNKLMRFLAKICSFFKTDALNVLDEAHQAQEQLTQLKTHYQQEITNTLKIIQNNPDINYEMKGRLAQEFNFELIAVIEDRAKVAAKPQEIRLMIKNLSGLFAGAKAKALATEIEEHLVSNTPLN